jgi:hypothetical protein
LNPKYKDKWICKGCEVKGCYGGYTEEKGANDPNEDILYCEECCHQYCLKCYEIYGEDHEHKLEKVKFKKCMED